MLTLPSGLKKFEGTDNVTRESAFNQNAVIADALIRDYNLVRNGKDSAGIFTVNDYKRKEDNTLYLKSTLSNPDANGNYQTLTQQYYGTDGTTIVNTKVWTLVYDSGKDLVSVTEV